MTIRYERKRLVVSADMYFPYMEIDGVKNVPEELKDGAGNDVIRVLFGELIASRERVSPGDYIVRFDDGTIKAIPYKEFTENYSNLPFVCPHCGKSEDDPIEVKAPDVIADDIVKDPILEKETGVLTPQEKSNELPLIKAGYRHPLAPHRR